MNRWLDLRLVIGLFFFVIGLLLIGNGIWEGGRVRATVNGWCGAGFLIFGVLMTLMSIVFQRQSDGRSSHSRDLHER